jgi:hypothetical protein
MPNNNMSEIRICLYISAIVLVLVTANWCYTIVQPRHVCIWQQFGRVTTNFTSGSGLHWHSPLVSCVNMYVGMDVDVVEYECSTKDGIRYKGKVSITNQLMIAEVVNSYLIHGPNPDRANIYDQTEFLMQSRCAEHSSREWLVDNFTSHDENLHGDLVEAQVTANSGLRIIKGKTKVYKMQPLNSDIGKTIQQEAEHRAKAKTAGEEKKLNQKLAELAAAQQANKDALERNHTKAIEQRKTDTQQTELERQKRQLLAEKERQEIRHQMDRAKARKDADIMLTNAKAAAEAKKLESLANKAWLSPQHLKKMAIDAFYHNTKFVFGDKIPTAWLSQHEQWGTITNHTNK